MFLYESDELAPLKQWELQDLAFQASQKVLNADPGQKLELLRDISQNFPLMARLDQCAISSLLTKSSLQITH
jgi:UDP-glucose:glycoprotein glucosyltransferase